METPATAAGFLQAYSEGRIGPQEAIHGAGLEGFGDLLDAKVAGGYRLPRDQGQEVQVEREVPGPGAGQAALPMLAEALGVPLPPGYCHLQNNEDRR